MDVQIAEHQKKSSIMTTKNHNTEQNLVKDLRKIRDQISLEIKDMTFKEERAYLDKFLGKNEHLGSSKNVITQESSTLDY